MPGGAAYDPETANVPLAQRLKQFNGMLMFIMLYVHAHCAL